jgi:hypothetical protein
MLSVAFFYCYADYQYVECRFTQLPNYHYVECRYAQRTLFITLSVVMLSVIMLSVVMLSVCESRRN